MDPQKYLPAVGRFSNSTCYKKNAKKAAERKRREREKHARKETGIRSARENTVFVAPKMLGDSDISVQKVGELENPRNCYVCKKMFKKLHHFYDAMCPECGDFNYAKRFQTADLKGQVAVVTGSRLKIGYHIRNLDFSYFSMLSRILFTFK